MLTLNLLPEQYKIEYNLEKRRRFVVAIFLSLCVILFVFNALMFATFIFLKTQNQALSGAFVFQNSEDDAKRLSSLEKNVSALNGQIARTTKAKNENFNIAGLLEKISEIPDAGSYLETVSIDNISGKVNMGGFAKDRESVLKFYDALLKSEFVSDGSLLNPIQNILKSKDITFVFDFKLTERSAK